MKLFIVMHKSGTGVAFTDKKDAIYASSGNVGQPYTGVDSIADAFRNELINEDDDEEISDKVPMLEITLTPVQQKKLGL